MMDNGYYCKLSDSEGPILYQYSPVPPHFSEGWRYMSVLVKYWSLYRYPSLLWNRKLTKMAEICHWKVYSQHQGSGGQEGGGFRGAGGGGVGGRSGEGEVGAGSNYYPPVVRRTRWQISRSCLWTKLKTRKEESFVLFSFWLVSFRPRQRDCS